VQIFAGKPGGINVKVDIILIEYAQTKMLDKKFPL